MFKLLIIFVITLTKVLCNKDWCEIEKLYCETGKSHIGCDPYQVERGDCFDVQLETMDEDLISIILKEHNLLRNQLAGGHLDPFPEGSKMRDVSWDETLEYLAAIQIQNCNMKHDQCRSTMSHPMAGQNLGFGGSSKPLEKNDVFLKSTINSWFEEYKNTPVSIIDRFENSFVSSSGHFAVMARENNHKIGCALINFNYYNQNVKYYGKMLTCNYAETNIINKHVYTSGESCSECSHYGLQCSWKYRNLCSSGGEVEEEENMEEEEEEEEDEEFTGEDVEAGVEETDDPQTNDDDDDDDIYYDENANDSDGDELYNAYEESIEEVNDYNDDHIETTTYYPLVSAETNDNSRDDKSSIVPIITTTDQRILPTIPPIAHTPMLNKTDRSLVVDVSGIATEFSTTRTESTSTTIKMDKTMPQTPSVKTQKSNGFRSLINLNIFFVFILFFFFNF